MYASEAAESAIFNVCSSVIVVHIGECFTPHIRERAEEEFVCVCVRMKEVYSLQYVRPKAEEMLS